jgi:hypothetical protein
VGPQRKVWLLFTVLEEGKIEGLVPTSRGTDT